MADLRTIRLNTTGMHCGSCAMLIDMTLTELEGVTEVSTDYATGVSSVTFDTGRVSVDELITAVRSSGYEASVGA